MNLLKISAQKVINFRPLIFLLSALGFLLLGKVAAAQVPPQPVNCEDTGSEFNSLRPYQASPCKKEPAQTARFCGNRLVLTDSVTGSRAIPPRQDPDCEQISSNTYRCSYLISGKAASYNIDLADASLPILGNTENELNDAEKTNQYVSWYLNGVIGRAEDKFLNPNDKPEDASRIADFSGPLNKLLPWEIQVRSRIKTIENALSTKAGNADIRHDQVVACITRLGGIPVPCKNNLFSQIVTRGLRLSDWDGKTPPLASDNKYQGKDFSVYWKDYLRWRGRRCTPDFTIPVINKKIYLCYDDPAVPNYWSNLFSYIPLSSLNKGVDSSTEDRVGLVSVDSKRVTAASPDLEIKNVSLQTTPAELYFAHTEEAAGLSDLLQMTFVAEGQPTNSGVSGVSPTESCDLKNIRTNEGDDLFAKSITGNLTYDAEFSCDFSGTASSSACKKDVSVGLGVVTQTPKADELWSRLVAGPAGIFKRIFPKVGAGGAILGLLDIPAATKVTYSGSGLVSAGNPGGRSGQSAELYFPHVGGISEYFLKGIQTILRPKGFGEQIISGAEGTFPSSGEIDCNTSAPDVSLKGTLNKQQTFQLALNWISGQTGNHVMDCYNDVVRRAREAGVNPALALWVWLHESNASNYNISDRDFGVLDVTGQGFVAQITGFLNRAKSATYRASNPMCRASGVTNDLQAWALIYQNGDCDPAKGEGFYNELVGIGVEPQWPWISPGCQLPTSPTDTTCP